MGLRRIAAGRRLPEVHMKISYFLAILFFAFAVQVTVGQSPRNAIEYYQRGYERQQRGDVRGAISDYDETLKRDSNFVEAYIARASARYRLSDLKGANADYEKAIEMGSEYAGAYLGRGTVRTELNNLDGAIDDYNHAISIKPEYAEAFYGRCLDRYLKGEFDQAIADCDHTLPGRVRCTVVINDPPASAKARSNVAGLSLPLTHRSR